MLVVVLGDFAMYWGHRLQHRWEPLWRFHSILHTTERLDFLAAGSPQFHHWHHAKDRDAGNYGNLAPYLDVLFGTHVAPDGPPPSARRAQPLRWRLRSPLWQASAPMDAPPLLDLYRDMARLRAFEVSVAELWRQGRISGEMHLGTGEEAINVGLAARLRPTDAVALDHRATGLMLLRGVDPAAILAEFLGYERGLCRGQGGHMHLFDPERLAACSGMVGASGPLAAGFALAAKRLRNGSIAVSTFGDGAINEGQLMESFNLAVAWKLPVLFVCKDNGWAVTTRSAEVTGGTLAARAAGFGLPVTEVNGLDVEAVCRTAAAAIAPIRDGRGPGFLLATASRLDGHYLGDALVRMADSPIAEGGETFRRAISAALSSGGGGIGARVRSMTGMVSTLGATRKDKRGTKRDPLELARKALGRQRGEADRIDAEMAERTADLVANVLEVG